MPTSTFYNLPEEKREKILRAIQDELAAGPIDNVSINKIIKRARIPRGSFYQYFQGKRDMVCYVMEELRIKIFGAALASLHANGGDLFQMFCDTMEFVTEYVRSSEHYTFYSNLLTDIRVQQDIARFYDGTFDKMPLAREIIESIDTDALDIRDERDFFDMAAVLLAVTRDASQEIFFDLENSEDAKARYRRKLSLIKRGFEREKGKAQC